MKEIFQKRRRLFLTRCSKYLRYVLNDHFVLVLLVFLGFLMLQYRELLLHFPSNPWLVILLLLAANLLLLFAGRPASYLEEADQLFLLAKEGMVVKETKAAGNRAFLVWGIVPVGGELLLAPLYLKLGLSPLAIGFGILGLLFLKFCYHRQQVKLLLRGDSLLWEKAIAKESQRKQSILQFFALFTNVKGVTTSVKRRAYLDVILQLIKKEHAKVWDYLFLRAFFRSGDFYPLALRLLGLSLIFLVTVKEAWLTTGLTVLFDYLLLFQLLPLYKVYDYQYLSQLYPVSSKVKKQSCQRIIGFIFYGVLLIQILVALFILEEKLYVFALVGVGLILQQVYLPIKAKKLFD